MRYKPASLVGVVAAADHRAAERTVHRELEEDRIEAGSFAQSRGKHSSWGMENQEKEALQEGQREGGEAELLQRKRESVRVRVRGARGEGQGQTMEEGSQKESKRRKWTHAEAAAVAQPIEEKVERKEGGNIAVVRVAAAVQVLAVAVPVRSREAVVVVEQTSPGPAVAVAIVVVVVAETIAHFGRSCAQQGQQLPLLVLAAGAIAVPVLVVHADTEGVAVLVAFAVAVRAAAG